MTEQNIKDLLAAPFTPPELKEREGRGKKMYSYIDARSAHQRLDDVLGVGGWQSSFKVLDPESKAVECTLSAFIDGQWVTRTDVGYPNSADDADNDGQEPLKASYSDALKRAAVQFGVGRHIYGIKPASVGQRRPDPASIAPPEASPGRKYDADELLSLMGQYGVTKEMLIKVTGVSTNGNPQISRWLSMNPTKTISQLVSIAVDIKQAAKEAVPF